MASTRDLWVILRARDEASRVLRSFSGNASDTARKVSQAAMGLSQAATIVSAGFIATGVAGLSFLKSSIDVAVEYERQVRHTATQVDNFAGDLEQLSNIGLRLARNVAIPFEEIQPALFDIFSSMEVGTKDAETLLTAFSKAAVAGQVNIQAVARATIGLLNAFQRPTADVNRLLDIQFQLVQEGVGTYEEWNERIGLVTPSAVRAGQSIETMMAALAAATRMGLSAARAGTSVARAFDAMSHPKTINNLKKLGVNALDAAGKMRPLDQVLMDFRKTLLKLPEKDRLGVILDVFKGAGGTIEARRFIQNMLLVGGNIEMFQDILKEMQTDTGSFEKAYDLMAGSVAAQTQLLSNRWTVLKESLGKALIPHFLKILELLNTWVEKFNNLDPETKRFIARILAMASVGAIILGVFFAIVAATAAIVAAFAIAGTEILAVTGILIALPIAAAGVILFFKKLWEESSRFRQILKNLKDTAIELWQQGIKPFFEGAAKAWKEHLEPAFQKLWQVFLYKVLPVVNDLILKFRQDLIPAAKEIGDKVGDFLSKAFQKAQEVIEKYLIPAIERATKYYYDHKEQIDKVISVLMFLGKWIAIIIGYLTVGLVAGFIISIAGGIALFINAVITVLEWIEKLIVWLHKLSDWVINLGTTIKNFVSKLLSAFGDVNNILYNVGKGIVQGLWNGILSMKDWFVGKITGFITNVIPGPIKKILRISSPSRLAIDMGKMVSIGLAQGMMSQIGRVSNASTGLAYAAIPNTGSGLYGSSFSNRENSNAPNKNITQNIYITTQEIDPKTHAMQLGWMLGARG